MRSEGGTESRIEALIGPLMADCGFSLVRVRFVTGGRPRLQIMAERPDGTMTVEDCARLSRALSPLLDVEDPIRGEYVLEVSSPGLDRPLVRPEDFVRFKGHEAKIELLRLFEGRKRFRGMLRGLEIGPSGEAVILEEEAGARLLLPVSLIDEAKLVLTDALIAQSLKGATGPLEDGAPVEMKPKKAQAREGRAAPRKRKRS